TLPIQTHAVKLNMPPPNQPKPPVPPPVVVLAIDFDGTITWNGTVVDFPTLDTYLQQEAAKGDDQDEIHLDPNRLAKYDTVAKVLSDAQRLGATKIGFVHIDQYMN
ncbi:MAG: biopolymer transporter ExbD, partial [Rhizomicrobium sp.]